jgi:purine-binding chemotaxis protein CheW
MAAAAPTLDLLKTRQYATVYVGGLFLGIEVARVQEVMRHQEMTDIPLAAPAIKGLINLRGQIVVAVDTRRALGLPPSDSDSPPRNIIIRSEEGGVSLLVDDIADVLDVPLHAFAPVPENMPAERRELIEGVYNLNEKLLLVLDTKRLLQKVCG